MAEVFKTKLDHYLFKFPDQPVCDGRGKLVLHEPPLEQKTVSEI